MKIVADDKIPFLKGVFEPFADIDYLPGDQIKPAMLKNTDVLITRSITSCNAELLEGTPIKLIATATIGDDHIDKQFCKEKGIKWVSAKGCNSNAVVQYVTTAIVELAAKEQYELSNKTLAVIGVGNIGLKVSRVAALLGMKVLPYDPPRERIEGSAGFASLKDIQAKADVITLHVPLTYGGKDKTFHLLDEEFFNGLKKPATLINTSRGGVLDTEVIKWAKSEGRISNLFLDVWENEPNIDMELLEMADIATPHIAGYSLVGKANGTAMVVNAISDFFSIGIKNWFPEISIDNLTVSVDCQNKSTLVVLYEIHRSVYSIQKDSEHLKLNPGKFENIRRDYKFRLENFQVDVELKNSNDKLNEIISGLGFKLKKQL